MIYASSADIFARRSYEFGPCVGVPRLQRWERANAMGLRPPPEVRDILLTEEGATKPKFAQTVFYGEV
jgi:DNA polymerase delta subunit 4